MRIRSKRDVGVPKDVFVVYVNDPCSVSACWSLKGRWIFLLAFVLLSIDDAEMRDIATNRKNE